MTFTLQHLSFIAKRTHAIVQMTWRLGRTALGRLLQGPVIVTFMLASTFAQAQSVHLEELTWTELRDRIAAGSTTVLVPIGGTEQSGPHMVLGKHNVRARILAAEIAARLGNAVVAPVISYVPEGSVKPPSGHMRFAGTISIPESAFEGVLEGAARSFRQHGFRDVVFLGDHGGYQIAEQRVADRLNREWGSDKRCRVHALLAYYEAAEGPQGAFANALRQKGYTDAEIGRHAGLADAALSMAVDPQTMALQYSIATPKCGGINHADFSIDGRYALFTCEFSGSIVKIDLVERKVSGYLVLSMPPTRFKEPAKNQAFDPSATEICSSTKGMPQDIRISPDGRRFYVADMEADGVHVVDGDAMSKVGFIPTGIGTHGLYPSRNGKRLYVANRGTHKIHGARRGPGQVSVIDFATEKVVATWPIPGGGSPDMGNLSLDGKWLWLSGRFDDVVYRIDTSSGAVSQVKVGQEPHGLTVWPQPGRYSLGHTGNLR